MNESIEDILHLINQLPQSPELRQQIAKLAYRAGLLEGECQRLRELLLEWRDNEPNDPNAWSLDFGARVDAALGKE